MLAARARRGPNVSEGVAPPQAAETQGDQRHLGVNAASTGERRVRLRDWCPQGRAGSSPVSSTATTPRAWGEIPKPLSRPRPAAYRRSFLLPPVGFRRGVLQLGEQLAKVLPVAQRLQV